MFFMSVAGLLTIGGLYVVNQPVQPRTSGQVAGASTDINSTDTNQEQVEEDIPLILTFDAVNYSSTDGGELITETDADSGTQAQLLRLEPGDSVTYEFDAKLESEVLSTIYFVADNKSFDFELDLNGERSTLSLNGQPSDKIYEGVSEISESFRLPTQSIYTLKITLTGQTTVDIFGVSLGEIEEGVELL